MAQIQKSKNLITKKPLPFTDRQNLRERGQNKNQMVKVQTKPISPSGLLALTVLALSLLLTAIYGIEQSQYAQIIKKAATAPLVEKGGQNEK